MQRIHEQNLTGDINDATKEAIWTWQKDEIAWTYCLLTHTINKSRITGERWLVGNKWGYIKIYQYEILSTSLRHSANTITHTNEEEFHETLEDARDYALRRIEKLLEFDNRNLLKSKEDILKYCKGEMTYTREVITEKA